MSSRPYSLEVPPLALMLLIAAILGGVGIVTTGAVQWKCVEKTGRLCPMEEMAPPAAAAGEMKGATR